MFDQIFHSPAINAANTLRRQCPHIIVEVRKSLSLLHLRPIRHHKCISPRVPKLLGVKLFVVSLMYSPKTFSPIGSCGVMIS